MTVEPVGVLVGLTASGKKTVGIEVALAQRAEIISLDSMKIYRGMDIGSAKPRTEDRSKVSFHLLDLVEPRESFSVGHFLHSAGRAIEEIRSRGKRTLFLGGTAFYLNCLVNGLVEGIEGDPEIRSKLLERVEAEGSAALHEELRREDPPTAEQIHPMDAKRIVRALEVIRITGNPFSWLKAHKTRRILDRPPRIAGLRRPWEEMMGRIDRRTEKMIQEGLIDEVRRILEAGGFGPESGKAIGYRQIVDYLEGRMTLNQAVEKINQATWRFARKQMTWYKRFDQIRWFEVTENLTVESVSKAVGGYLFGPPSR